MSDSPRARSPPALDGAHGDARAGDDARARAGDLGGARPARRSRPRRRPTAERDGILTVTCDAAVWAQELDLMAAELIEKLNAALGEDAIRELRCRTG